ncbi:nesprin-1-like [Toxotes jaculatrix]|uniref:nesprin-1-like n=1 Tax=Toxotes jaculatrix TaxID=941984 RepID=UPI001B3AE6C0|nr:nesprin-1-like [Toxotes jaculatrix]
MASPRHYGHSTRDIANVMQKLQVSVKAENSITSHVAPLHQSVQAAEAYIPTYASGFYRLLAYQADRRESRRSLGYKMERRAGGEASPKKNTSLNLVTGFYHYLRAGKHGLVLKRLQNEQEAVQKRTFTKWINSHLAKHVPPLVVTDLFEDIKDGVMLLALLEVLSGQKLPCEQGKKLKRIHWVANIGTALNFLEGRKIKLVNINSTDIVDGRPSIVLGLVWTIILYFQIEELTSSLPALHGMSSSTSSLDSSTSSTDTTSPPVKRKPLPPQGGARKALLRWVQQTATKRLGLEVKDFGPSWRTGLAFFAVIHSLRPNLVDMERVWRRPNRENLQEAFFLAETELGIPQLLDPEDVDVDKPDEKSIMTYVAQFLKHHPDRRQSDSDGQSEEEREQRKSLRELKMWLDQLERDAIQAQEAEGNLAQQYQLFKTLRVQLEVRRKHVEGALQSTQRDGILTVDQALVKQAWERVSNKLLDWHLQLDRSLPAPLNMVGAWLHEAEGALRQEIIIQQAHDVTANTVHRALEQHKDVLKSLESHQQVFQRIHKDRSVDGVLVPPDQLQDMAERMNFISTSSSIHMAKMEFWENKHHMQAFLTLAETKLKSWIIKYGRQESVELMLHNYVSFVEKQHFFENYEALFQSLKQSAEAYVSADSSVDEGEMGVRRFMREVVTQWRSLSMEVRSVRSMLEEVLSNWERYSSTVASLQAWLEDAEEALIQPENTKREFFRNLSHWMDQHAAMNDAGNFLIETCDETVSLDLKQQLLILNGRWRDLFLKVKQYARADELEKWRKDHLRAVSALKELLDTAEAKLNAPVKVSFLNVRAFLQDVENTKQKVVAMETQYKLAARSAQLLAKDAPQDEAARVMATVATAKSQLSKVRERCPSLVRECHVLLPLLEEMEKHITAFYQALERASRITSAARDPDSQSQTQHKQKWQDLLNQQQSCKRCLSVIERNHHTVQRTLSTSKVLRNFDLSLLQKRVAEIQSSAQALLKEVGEWRRQEEANNCLRRRFEESRQELERVLKKAQGYLRETGDAEDLLKRHTDFFGQLDQRVLSVFLKACDELTDILPQEEQQGLQETVRRLHKHWKDIQGEVPSHLLRLKVEVEQSRVAVILQDCRAELDREMQALSGTCTSERVIKEHRTFFRERKPLTLCEKRIRNMEDLCHKLPDNDPAYRTLDSTRRAVDEVTEQIKSTHLKLEQHPDKWKEWNERFCELSDWLSSQRRQVRLLRETARNSSRKEQVNAAVQALQEAVDAREESLLWLKNILAELSEWGEEGSAKFQYEELREEVRGALEEVLRARREAEEQTRKILDAEDLEEAKQLYLIHQVCIEQHLKRLHANRREAELLVSHCRQLQTGEVLSESLQELEEAFREVDRKSGAKEHNLQATLTWWQNFEAERETVWRFISNTNNELHKELIFNSLDSLRMELEHNKELLTGVEECCVRADLLLEKAADIQLGPKNQTLLLQQAQSTREAVTQLQDHLNKNVVQLERMCVWWERFSSESETLSSWISEKEQELEAINTTSSLDPLDKNISTVEEVGKGLEERRAALGHMEADCEALSRFVTPGEAGRIRARLTQIRRYWEELKGRVEQLGGQLNQSASYRQRYNDNLEQVKKTMSDIEEKLDCPITQCSSSSETYKILQNHMEVCQTVEQLKPRLMALCSAMKRLGEGSQLEEEVANLQKQQGQFLGKASEKQATLESLLALWQRFEKEISSMKSWLDRCESVCCPDTELLSADKVKLRNELQNIQEMQRETPSYDVLLQGLVNLGLCLYPTAPEARIQEFSDDLTQLQERSTSVKNSISHRFELLKSQLSQLELFDEALLTLTQRSENFLSVLRSSSQVDIADLEAAITKLKEHEVKLQAYASLRETLHQRESSLLCSSTPEAQQQLQGWREDCLQPLSESQRLLLVRKECLTELKTFLGKHAVATKAVHRLHEAVEGRGSWDRAKAEELHHGIGEVAKDVARLEAEAVGLDGQLSKAHLQLCGSEWPGSRDTGHPQGRTSCRGQAVALTMALEEVQRGVGWRQSEADALGALWSSFRERREEVMKNLRKLEDEVRHEGARESSVQAFQNRLRFFVQLEDELQSLQHSQQWLEEKGSQLAQRDSELAGEALREVALVKTAWENVRTLITNGQEQSGLVVDLLRQFHHLKSVLSTVVESAHSIAHNLPDHNHNTQEAKRTFIRHETVQAELREKQEDMDQLISTVEDLQRELEKVPSSDTSSIQRDMETLRDQWLELAAQLSEVSERIQTNVERLGLCVALWDDLKAMEQDINQWTATSIADLTDSVTNLSDKEKAEAQLTTFQAEVEKREQKLDALQERVTELKERAKLQETPLQMQVLESDLRKKMTHAQEVYNQAKHTLTYFTFQKQRLEDLMSQMAERLEAVEGSLSDLTEATSPEDIGTVKNLQSVVQQQRADMDSARDALTALCRSHPSQELSSLSSDLTSIAKRTEAVAQRCAKTRGSLQDGLQLHFNAELVQDFHAWLADLKLELKECSNQSGDVAILGAKLQRLKVSLERTSEGEKRLSQVSQEAERLQLHLPKAGAAQVQEHLSSCQREWKNYLDSCSQSQRDLEESIGLLKNFDDCVEGIRDWLKQMELSLQSEPVLGAESQQGTPDATEELERMENLHKELLARRDSIERVCQEAQSLSDAGRGSGGEVRVTGQLQMEHQALLKAARERLRGCQESQAFGETLQGVWAWLEEIQERLGTVDSTMGTKEQLEQRLETVQDILLLKGEGEVKLNMAMGKGELALRSYGAAGQEVVRSQLQEVEDAWATLLVTAMSCHSRLEWTVSQWGGYLDSAAQLRCWMEAVEREVCAPLTPQPGPREKASQLERLRALLADLEDHQVALSSLEEKARELFKKTGDASFNHGARVQLQAQFDDLTALVEERVRLAQAVVLEHQEYLEAVRELTDWLMTAGEELQHWSDTSGDSNSIKKKLSEVRERVECRLLEGRERLSRVRRSAATTAEHTAAGGCEAMDRQLGALSQALEQWEGAALRARDGLEGALAAAAASEEEYNRLTAQLEDELKELDGRLRRWSQELIKAEGRSNGEEAVEGWQLAKVQ